MTSNIPIALGRNVTSTKAAKSEDENSFLEEGAAGMMKSAARKSIAFRPISPRTPGDKETNEKRAKGREEIQKEIRSTRRSLDYKKYLISQNLF